MTTKALWRPWHNHKSCSGFSAHRVTWYLGGGWDPEGEVKVATRGSRMLFFTVCFQVRRSDVLPLWEVPVSHCC